MLGNNVVIGHLHSKYKLESKTFKNFELPAGNQTKRKNKKFSFLYIPTLRNINQAFKKRDMLMNLFNFSSHSSHYVKHNVWKSAKFIYRNFLTKTRSTYARISCGETNTTEK